MELMYDLLVGYCVWLSKYRLSWASGEDARLGFQPDILRPEDNMREVRESPRFRRLIGPCCMAGMEVVLRVLFIKAGLLYLNSTDSHIKLKLCTPPP